MQSVQYTTCYMDLFVLLQGYNSSLLRMNKHNIDSLNLLYMCV